MAPLTTSPGILLTYPSFLVTPPVFHIWNISKHFYAIFERDFFLSLKYANLLCSFKKNKPWLKELEQTVFKYKV